MRFDPKPRGHARRSFVAAFALLVAVLALAPNAVRAERVLRHEFTVSAPVSRVWHLWTTAEGLRAWFMPEVDIDLRVGGAIRFISTPGKKLGDEGTTELPILTYEPMHLLSYRTSAPAQFPTVREAKRTWSVIRFHPVDESTTHVVVSVHGWQEGEEWDRAYAFFDEANPAVYAKLKAAAESEAGAAMQATADAYVAPRSLEHSIDINAPRAAVWQAIATEEGARQWIAPVVTMDLRVGGTIQSNYNAAATIGDEGTIVNHVLSYAPEGMLSLQYRAPANAPFAILGEKTWSVMLLEEVTPGRTNLRLTGLGYGEGEEWDKLYAFFEAGNAATLQKLKDVAEASVDGIITGRGEVGDPMALLALLAGGEWIHESVKPGGGGTFRVRNLVERGPADGVYVGKSWLGSEKGMFLHGATQIWREPGSRHVRFQSINEEGALARGRIRLTGTSTVTWDWEQTAQDGTMTPYHVTMAFDGNDRYTFALGHIEADGSRTPLVNAAFTRMEKMPDAWAPAK